MSNMAHLATVLQQMSDAFRDWQAANEEFHSRPSNDPAATKKVSRAASRALSFAADHLYELTEAVSRWGLHARFGPGPEHYSDLLAVIGKVAATKGKEDPGSHWNDDEYVFLVSRWPDANVVDELDRLAKRAEEEAEPVLSNLRNTIKRLRPSTTGPWPKPKDVLREAGGARKANLDGLRTLEALGEYKGFARARHKRYGQSSEP